MKHIFIVNPRAGKVDRVEEITNDLEKYKKDYDISIYVTKCRGDAREYVRDFLDSHPKDEIYRFYACGGDGTLHDVVNGAVNHSNAEVACYASGSGNDFVKNFSNPEGFRNLDKTIKGKAHPIDLLKVDDQYSVNIFNYGFDGEVTFAMLKFKRWPLITGTMAYNLAAITSLLFKMNQYLKLTEDNEVIFDRKGLLVAVANGYCYGGGYHCAPEAKVDDGLIDVCLVKRISKFKAAGLMKVYKKGEHIHNDKMGNLIDYRKCKHVVVESSRPVAYAIDGEVYRKQKVKIDIVEKAINFVIPQE